MDNFEKTFREERQIPINRNNMFYSEQDYLFEMEIGKNYLEEDVNQTLILYQVDLEKTNLDAIYNESKSDSIVYKPPVELHCLYTIEEPELLSYEKTKCEIKIGDYVGVVVSSNHIEYYTVTNDGRNNFNNGRTTFGYKSSYRSIEAAPVSSENEFNGK